MSFAIAAAGTGGHVFPGLAVGEALVERGVPHSDILFVGGSRLEAEVYPEAGFPFLGVEIRGLSRSLTPSNLSLPLVVWRAVGRIAGVFAERGVRAMLGLGGYVTVPAALAARRAGAALAVSEQNAEAGLANRIAGRLARRRFGSFPLTRGLPGAEWAGNPIRRSLSCFDRSRLAPRARLRYGLQPHLPVLGVFGGSLGAGVLNVAVRRLVEQWSGPPLQVLHLAGAAHAAGLEQSVESHVPWRVVGFEPEMEHFYAASDLVLARAGGAVAELTATSTPSILVPGRFGSAGHQQANAEVLAGAGAAVVLQEEALEGLGDLVASLLREEGRLAAMADACRGLARPDAAAVIAEALEEMHG